MRRASLTVLVLCACKFVSEGEGGSAESTSSTGGEESTSTASTSSSTSSGGKSTSLTSSTGDEESSSSAVDLAPSDDAASTGEVIEDYALAFDGTSYARRVAVEEGFVWPSTDFTVEVWAEILDTNATGIIFDTANVEFQDGWVLYLHNEAHSLVFSFFDENNLNQVVMGPAVEDIGTGWHHLAATKYGGVVFIHVDGVMTTQQFVAPSLSFDNTTLWSLGGSPDDDLDYRLHSVTIDDIRISSFARYEADFTPLAAYDDEDSVILLMPLDDGQGYAASDEITGIDFVIDSAAWVLGNAE